MGKRPSFLDALNSLDPAPGQEPLEGATLVGLSLGNCIADMINDPALLERVKKIVSNTYCQNETEFRQVWEHYEKSLWVKNPSWARLAAESLYQGGRIYQPRAEDRKHQMPYGNPSWQEHKMPSKWWISNIEYRRHLLGKLRELHEQLQSPEEER